MATEEAKLPAALLIVDSSKVYTFKKPLIKIGRSLDNDLILEHPTVSRQHAELVFTDGRFEIVDLESTGGTFVNGMKVDRRRLSKGDVITLASLHLVFGEDEFPAAGTPSEYEPPSEPDPESSNTKTLPQRSRRR